MHSDAQSRRSKRYASMWCFLVLCFDVRLGLGLCSLIVGCARDDDHLGAVRMRHSCLQCCAADMLALVHASRHLSMAFTKGPFAKKKTLFILAFFFLTLKVSFLCAEAMWHLYSYAQ